MIVVQALGLAKDELLLLGAVSMSLGSIGYVAVPWGTLAMGPEDKALALYEQIETANQAYFDKYGVWPHEVSSNTPASNVVVLMSRKALTGVYSDSAVYQPVMDGLLEARADGLVARHTYGQGGKVMQVALNGGAYRYVVEFDNLTINQARALDESIDGEFGPGKGRLRMTEEDGVVTAKYLANARNKVVASK
ncbi:MAG: hypothetical protein WAZ18_06110 [Alphaproteobacteria bacterium]